MAVDCAHARRRQMGPGGRPGTSEHRQARKRCGAVVIPATRGRVARQDHTGSKVHPTSRAVAGVAVIVLLICALRVLGHVIRYGVDIPFWDEWSFIDALRPVAS